MSGADLLDGRDEGDSQSSLAPGQFRLNRLQVSNWGTFCGTHAIDVPRRGLLLTGESGSGKSSLLDAMSALMIAPQEAHFNSAATDSQSGDDRRSLMSYVRGAHRNHTDEDTLEVRTTYLRSGPTCAGIALTWDDGLGRVLSAVRLFHIKGSSRAAQDLRSVYALAPADVELIDWVSRISSGIDRKSLKAAFSDAQFYDSYNTFGVQLRKRVGIGRETAQRLLHKAMSAKSMRSLDQLLRTFMLDEPETFEAADHAVEEFTELRDAHAAVADAREQVDALTPIRGAWNERISALRELGELESLRQSLPAFRAKLDVDDALRIIDESTTELDQLRAQRHDLGERRTTLERALDDARDDLVRAGGADVNRAHRDLETDEEHLAKLERNHQILSERLGRVESAFLLPHTRAEHERLRQRARDHLAELKSKRSADTGFEARDARRRAREKRESLEAEIRALQRSGTRIDSRLSKVRDLVATHLALPSKSVPFVGELMDIDDSRWSGPIERLAFGFARTLLVPDEVFDEALSFIDSHELGIRLVFERVTAKDEHVLAPPPGSVASKLRIASGPFETWMRAEVVRRLPHICVEDAQHMDDHPRALSLNGTIRDGRRYLKDDVHRLDDRAHWCIGTSNADKLDELIARLTQADDDLAKADARVEALDRADDERQERIRALDFIEATAWEDVDVEGGRERVELARARVAELEKKDSSLAHLRRRLEELQEAHSATMSEADALGVRLGTVQKDLADAEARRDRADSVLAASSLDPAVVEQLFHRARALRRSLSGSEIASVTDTIRDDLDQGITAKKDEESALQRTILGLQKAYSSKWPNLVADLVPDSVDSAPDFLVVLDRLQADRLPEFESRFRRLLAEQSQNNLGRIHEEISSSLTRVRKAIAPANESLSQTPFDRRRGRYLRIEPSARITLEVREFSDALRAVTKGAFNSPTETLDESERRFQSMRALLERLGSQDPTDLKWRERVLDTRRHVGFRAIEFDSSGTQTDVYEGSGGRSGGQSQKLVTFCLVAALRYQLADTGKTVPRYGTVALDEAFDKTDAEFTEAGLAVFDRFRFQLVLATPLKMLQTIGEHVGGAVTVSNPTGEASRLAAISFTKVADSSEGGSGAESAS